MKLVAVNPITAAVLPAARVALLEIADALEKSLPIAGIGFNMEYWEAENAGDYTGWRCGTTCCIGGHLSHKVGPLPPYRDRTELLFGPGYTYQQHHAASHLFCLNTYNEDPCLYATPKQAAAAIRSWLIDFNPRWEEHALQSGSWRV